MNLVSSSLCFHTRLSYSPSIDIPSGRSSHSPAPDGVEDGEADERPRKKRKCNKSVVFVELEEDDNDQKKKASAEGMSNYMHQATHHRSLKDDNYEMESLGEDESGSEESGEDEDKSKKKKKKPTSRDLINGFRATQPMSGTPGVVNKSGDIEDNQMRKYVCYNFIFFSPTCHRLGTRRRKLELSRLYFQGGNRTRTITRRETTNKMKTGQTTTTL